MVEGYMKKLSCIAEEKRNIEKDIKEINIVQLLI